MTRAISRSRPTTGSEPPPPAMRVRSRLYWSRTRVSVLRQGGLSVEPFLTKRCDLALEFEAHPGGQWDYVGPSVFVTDATGRYAGSLVAPDDVLLRAIGRQVDLRLVDEARRLVEQLLPRLAEGYTGPVGVDMMVVEGKRGEAALHPSVVGGMLYLGLFSTMLGFLLQNVGQKYVRPAPAAVLLSTESLFGVVFSTLLLHESLSPRMWLGCGLIFLAVLLSETGLGLDPLLERLGGRKGRNAAG